VEETIIIPAVELNIAPSEHGSLITFKTTNAGVYFAIVAQVGFASEQAGLNIDVYVQDPEAPVFSNAFYVAEGGKRTFAVRDESKTEVNLLELIQNKDGELNNALIADAMNSGVNETIANIDGLSADDVNVIFSMLAGAPAA
jgi:hypothetical protein